ncbi:MULTISPECIES: LysR family transcriptional regulator [Bacillus]|uniref:HTH-type transcriptional regulator CzcR n=3 Tax=Bacillus thuringiensis TaxID=1428 RepID=A0AAP4QCY9_BACTU|nr:MULTISPECIES: LysR family transcriptional regulator [Bacillus cereus group]MEC2878688.1 LysR family transcriptional regulator [Bacillus cereus]AGG05606.1 transcriptional regulator, LysR family [Bacillus thuringiensis serovar thuringiensis str. IS5056]ARP61204.1 LysR family transcriptional regulator [Bacillus thuringiensis]EEM31968.1 Transcription regulator LysR family VC1617 [Bacillus thuringiensis serovar thuringiensis str. T01001]EEM62338.1 Transcription regulator LysR family VC1617 [Baci
MELRQLEYFITLCKELHFTRAADKLGITQPTLSHQIKALEDEIGMPLFDRLGKKIAITDVGYILAKECKTIFNALDNVKEEISELKEIKGGKIAIATLPGELTNLVSTLLLDFHKNYPEVIVKIISSDEILELINQNQVNFAVTIDSSDYVFEEEKIIKIPLYTDELFLVLSKNHSLVNEKEIQFSELNKLPLILFPDNHECRKLLDYTCIARKINMYPIIETSSIESLFDFVRSDFGVTVVSKTLLDITEDNDLSAIPIVNPSVSREVNLILRRDKFIGFGTRNFIELLTNEIIKLGFPISEQSKEQIRKLIKE